jgi:hypothetical protein
MIDRRLAKARSKEGRKEPKGGGTEGGGAGGGKKEEDLGEGRGDGRPTNYLSPPYRGDLGRVPSHGALPRCGEDLL